MSQVQLQIVKQLHGAILRPHAVIKPRIFTVGIGIFDWESFDRERREVERELGISKVLGPWFDSPHRLWQATASLGSRGCDYLWGYNLTYKVLLRVF
jgi:hypothetical protein